MTHIKQKLLKNLHESLEVDKNESFVIFTRRLQLSAVETIVKARQSFTAIISTQMVFDQGECKCD